MRDTLWSFCISLAPLLGSCSSNDKVLTADEMSPATVQHDAGGSGMDAGSATDAGSIAAANDADSIRSQASTPECDMTGVWIARQQTVNVALGVPQTANNWYYFELTQSGDTFTVVDHFDCGIEVMGTAHVQLTRETTATLIAHNVQKGRTGTLRTGDDGNCALELGRFWSVRGASESKYLPNATRNAQESVSELAGRLPLPSRDKTEGAEDWDNDGKLGIAWHISGVVSGTRNSVQRDWTRWFSDPATPIKPSRTWSDDLTLRTEFEAQEVVLDPSVGLLASGSTVDATAKHRVTLRFLGRSTNDPRVAALVKPDKLDTCYAIQQALAPGQL